MWVICAFVSVSGVCVCVWHLYKVYIYRASSWLCTFCVLRDLAGISALKCNHNVLMLVDILTKSAQASMLVFFVISELTDLCFQACKLHCMLPASAILYHRYWLHMKVKCLSLKVTLRPGLRPVICIWLLSLSLSLYLCLSLSVFLELNIRSILTFCAFWSVIR